MTNKPTNKLLPLLLGGLLALGTASCNQGAVALPFGHMRIGLPSTDSTVLCAPEGSPYQSSMNAASYLHYKDSTENWVDLVYPGLRSTIQLTYKPVEENLEELVRDAQKLAYKHTVKASGMREQFFAYPEKKVYGMYYEMSGASATTTQFYATDSTHHFLRGVLYHYSVPNPDSLAPVTNFLRGEMMNFIAELTWTSTDSTSAE